MFEYIHIFVFVDILIKGKNISLRALEPGDIDHLYKWENDTSIWQVSNSLTPYSRHILEQYVLNADQDIYTAKQLRLVICLNNDRKPIGCIDLFDFDPQHRRAGIGILIADETERGKGHSSEALSLLINYAFNTLNLHQLYSNVGANNDHSIKLFKKNYFTEVGIKKDWIKKGRGWENELLLQRINK